MHSLTPSIDHSIRWTFDIFIENLGRSSCQITSGYRLYFSHVRMKIIIHISSTLGLIHWVWHIALHTSIAIDKISPVCIIHGYHNIWWYDIFYNIRLKRNRRNIFQMDPKSEKCRNNRNNPWLKEIVDFRISIIIQIIGIQCWIFRFVSDINFTKGISVNISLPGSSITVSSKNKLANFVVK